MEIMMNHNHHKFDDEHTTSYSHHHNDPPDPMNDDDKINFLNRISIKPMTTTETRLIKVENNRKIHSIILFSILILLILIVCHLGSTIGNVLALKNVNPDSHHHHNKHPHPHHQHYNDHHSHPQEQVKFDQILNSDEPNTERQKTSSNNNSKKPIVIKPFIRITETTGNRHEMRRKSSKDFLIELILSLPDSIIHSFSSSHSYNIKNNNLILRLTAIDIFNEKNDFDNIENNNDNQTVQHPFIATTPRTRTQNDIYNDNDSFLRLLSPNFIYTEQYKSDDNNDFHETIERIYRNHSEYYLNNLIEQLFSSSSISSSTTISKNSNNNVDLCQMFTGNTAKWNDSSVEATINICQDGTMNGFITLHSFGHILMENNAQKIRKKCRQIYRSWSNDNILLLEFCPISMIISRFPNNYIPLMNDIRNSENRGKRSYSSERTIEIAVVTDSSMYSYHGNSLRNYVFTLISMVSHIFKHYSIGNEINIKLVKLTSLLDDKQEKNWFGSAHKTLRHFCRWQYEHNHPKDEHPHHYDTAIFLTKIDLCSKNEFHSNDIDNDRIRSKSSCDTLGLAHSGQICDPASSCAIIEDNGLSAAFTISHELGHLLGVPHDDEEQCKKFYYQSGYPRTHEFNVMVRMIDSTSHMWSWSSCSKHFITEFLDSGYGDCLLDNNAIDVRHSSEIRVYDTYQRRSFLQNWIDKLARVPAGALYSADEQCRLVYDKNSSICLDMPYCKKLWCTTDSAGCRTQHLPWADGTECGNGYWCQEGECVRIDRTHLRSIDGGWGEWSPWSECSLNCGGGIRKSRRECNNPSPKNGGRFCLGERVKYESCNLEPCGYHSSPGDTRIRQCSEFNRYNLTWTPKYSGVSDPCALYCESNTGESHKLKSKVVDGTPCYPDSYDICVNGKCLSAGCDRILGSNVRTDNCGVCGGDNSTCREISGRFKPRSISHGYTFVLSIPPGATNVEIIKEPTGTSDNWLALRGDDGNYLLNGRFTVNVYERKWFYGGTTIDYSGIKNHGLERINITRPIQNPLHLEVLCVGALHAPTINYHYAVTMDNPYVNYQWVVETDWSQCSKACNGEQERKPFCVAILRPSQNITSHFMVNEIRVKDEYCEQQSRPDTEYRVCNDHCELEWHIYQTGPCSSKCGHGFRSRHVNCTQTFMNYNERIYIDDFYCFHLGPKPLEQENCTGNECRVTYQWQYSDWSSCALRQTCGTGQQTRQAQCMSTTYFEPDPLDVIHSNVGQELCMQNLPEPVTVQSCHVECPRWKTDSWSECKGSCEHSEQVRTVICIHGDQQVNDAYCQTLEAKPIERMSCELSHCQSNNPMDELEQSNNNKTIHSQEKDFFNSQDNEIDFPYSHRRGTWQSGEWSSCETLFDLIREFQERSTNGFHVPKCFESKEQIDGFRERFVHLFKLNDSLNLNSYNELASLLNLDLSNFSKRRYVACVYPNTQRVLPDNECDHKSRPKSEEYCPLGKLLTKKMPPFEAKLCEEVVDVQQSNRINEVSSYFNHYKINEEIRWKSGDWSPCFCDTKRKIMVRKRSIYCVRLIDDHTLSEDYCSRDSRLTKPNELEECSSDYHQNQLSCDPYTSEQQITSNSSMSNLTKVKDIFDTNRYQQSTSHHSNQQTSFSSPDQQLIILTPTLSSSISTTSRPILFSSSSSLISPLSSNIPILPTVSSRTIFESTDSPQFPSSYNSHITSKQETLSSSYSLPKNQNHIKSHMQASTRIPNISYTLNRIPQNMNGGWTEWTDWSECSVSCGNGVQHREPRCTNEQHCDPQLKPEPQYRSCYRMCGFFQWHYSDWSSCSAKCGTGFRTRTAKCHDWTNFPVPDRFCENEQLITKEQCQIIDCKLVWRSGQWSECSQQCGPGLQTRTVSCHRINNHGVIDPEPLDHSNSILRRKRKENYKPKRKSMNKKYKLTKRRNRQSIFYSDQWCDMNNRPSQTQSCNRGTCLQPHMNDAYVWKTSDWQMCSTPCGDGYQRRKVYCFSQRSNNRVDRSLCDLKLKPEKRRHCNLRSCEVISCQDRRDRARNRSDGEYELWVQGIMIRVYCFGMDFLKKPLEYLILNENAYDDNYSEMNVGSSDCSRYSRYSVKMKKSTVHFKYVRFDPSTMEIFVNDTRFAMSHDSDSNTLPITKNKIGYGQAMIQGCPLSSTLDHSNSIDCYFASDQENVGSMFSINLQKTGLIIDEDQWIITENNYGLMRKNVQISRNGEKVIGHCSFINGKLPITIPSNSECLIGCRSIHNTIKVRIP